MSLKIKLSIIAVLILQIALTNTQCGIRWRGGCGRKRRAQTDLQHYWDSELDSNCTGLKIETNNKTLSFKTARRRFCEDFLKLINLNVSSEVCR